MVIYDLGHEREGLYRDMFIVTHVAIIVKIKNTYAVLRTIPAIIVSKQLRKNVVHIFVIADVKRPGGRSSVSKKLFKLSCPEVLKFISLRSGGSKFFCGVRFIFF
jgi:hypothetical protein